MNKKLIQIVLISIFCLYIGFNFSNSLIFGQLAKEEQECSKQAEIVRKKSKIIVECLAPGLASKLDYFKFYGMGFLVSIFLIFVINKTVNKFYVKR